MNTDLFSPANELEREAFDLLKRGFQNGPSLGALCGALASCIEVSTAHVNALASSGESLTPAHVACLCLTGSTARAAEMVRWLRDSAQRLAAMPPDAAALNEIMQDTGKAWETFQRNVFGEGVQ